MTDFRYSVEIRWSDVDGHYLAAISELPGCISDGKTAEEACKNVIGMAKDWLETAKELKRSIPKPISIEEHLKGQRKEITAAVRREVENHIAPAIKAEIKKAVRQLLAQQESAPSQGSVLFGARSRVPFFEEADA